MKSYLKAKKKQKIKDLKYARNLRSKIGILRNKSEQTDSCVRQVKTSMGSAMKSDNTEELIRRVSIINDGCLDKINYSYSLANRLITKIENEIQEIEYKISEIERDEEEERKRKRKAREKWQKII